MGKNSNYIHSCIRNVSATVWKWLNYWTFSEFPIFMTSAGQLYILRKCLYFYCILLDVWRSWDRNFILWTNFCLVSKHFSRTTVRAKIMVLSLLTFHKFGTWGKMKLKVVAPVILYKNKLFGGLHFIFAPNSLDATSSWNVFSMVYKMFNWTKKRNQRH